MGFVESLPVQRIRPVLALPLYLGTLRDASGYGADGVNTNCHWGQSGDTDKIVFSGGRIMCPDNDAQQLARGTIFAWGHFDNYAAGDRIVSKRDAGGTNYDFHFQSAVNLGLYDGAATRTCPITWAGSKSVAVTFADGEISTGYIDGASPTAFNAASAITADDAPISIGSLAWGPSPQSNPICGVLIFPAVLTPAEILSLHNWSQERITPRKQWPGGGLDIPTLTGTPLEPMFLRNIQSTRVTLANEVGPSSQLSNTGYQIESGTWRVNEDAATGERYIECVVAGIISRRNLEAYGTWEFDLYKGADANLTRAYFIADDTTLTSTGYRLEIAVTEQVNLVQSGVTFVSRSPVDYVAILTKYRFRITRSPAGEFTYYIIGSVFSEWTLIDSSVFGSNPGTNNVTTTSQYCAFDFDAGDRLYLDRQFAGVLPPV